MLDEDLAEELAQRTVTIEHHIPGNGCCGIEHSEEYMLCIFGYYLQYFGTKEGSERARLFFKEEVKQQLIQMLSDTH